MTQNVEGCGIDCTIGKKKFKSSSRSTKELCRLENLHKKFHFGNHLYIKN